MLWFLTLFVTCFGMSPIQLFNNYNKATSDWIKGGKGDVIMVLRTKILSLHLGSRKALEAAMESITELVPWLVAQPEFPPGLDPLVLFKFMHFLLIPVILEVFCPKAFADNIIAFHQTEEHIKEALPLLEYSLRSPITLDNGETVTVNKACSNDDVGLRRICQDLFSILIELYQRIGQEEKARRYLQMYNEPRDASRRFAGVQLTYRQLPGQISDKFL